MTAITGTITGAQQSAVFNSTQGVSDVLTVARGGALYLEAQLGSGEWITISGVVGAYNVLTPDAGVNYRFRGVDGTDTDYYMGP